MARVRPLSPRAADAARMLGEQIRVGRIERRWTLSELGERVGVSVPTIRKVERGDPTVALGVAFEAAVTVGLPLFGEDDERWRLEQHRIDDRLALLPKTARKQVIDDAF